MPERTINHALLTLSACWQAEAHHVARRALYEALICCLPPATREMLSIIAATGEDGFIWRNHGMSAHEHALTIRRLQELSLVQSRGTGRGARWYAVDAMERP